jgi:hypothetical protein
MYNARQQINEQITTWGPFYLRLQPFHVTRQEISVCDHTMLLLCAQTLLRRSYKRKRVENVYFIIAVLIIMTIIIVTITISFTISVEKCRSAKMLRIVFIILK